MKTVAYVRVSSKAQDAKSQRHAIVRALGADADDEVVWYSEKASAKTNDRPILKRLLADARAGHFQRLVVFRLDRLTRTGVADTFGLVSELRASGVTLVSVSDNLTIKPDADDTVSTVMVFALGLAAKLERTAINERISAARTRMEARGEAWGRPPKMTPAQVTTARALKAKGRTVREIAKALGISKSTIGSAVRVSA